MTIKKIIKHFNAAYIGAALSTAVAAYLVVTNGYSLQLAVNYIAIAAPLIMFGLLQDYHAARMRDAKQYYEQALVESEELYSKKVAEIKELLDDYYGHPQRR